MTFDFLAMKTTSTMERRAEKERLKEVERAKAQTIEQVMACLFFHLPVCIRERKRGHISMLGVRYHDNIGKYSGSN